VLYSIQLMKLLILPTSASECWISGIGGGGGSVPASDSEKPYVL
jgi:hypothetical protein